MKAVFIGCVESSYRTLKALIDYDEISLVGVVTRKVSPFNADFVSLDRLANDNGIPVFYADENQPDDMANWIEAQEPEIGFCIGWSYLLPPQILSIPTAGFVGYHPALLPRNRGRHPIIWALALGLDVTGSTFFMMDKGADSGDIVSQEQVPIHPDDDAGTLYARLLDVAESQILNIATHLTSDKLTRYPQDNAAATYWRKRSKQDGQIDWRMPAEGIRNLVRALAPPYPGAHCIVNDQECKVHKVDTVVADIDLEPGRVISVTKNVITIKAGVDAVRLIKHDIDDLPQPLDCLS